MGRHRKAQEPRKRGASGAETQAIIVHQPAKLPSVFEGHPRLEDAVRDYVEASEAPNTVRARESDWRVFSIWCVKHSVVALPAEPATVAAFLADQSDPEEPGVKPKAVATVIRYAQSIRAMHKLSNHESPVEHEAVRKVLLGIRRLRGKRQKQKEAMTAERVAEVLPGISHSNHALYLRDRVVILLGLATALRRSELCAIDVEDLLEVEDGIILDLKRSKVDQEGAGRPIAVHRVEQIEFCPVKAVEEWLVVLNRKTGPLLCGVRKSGELRGTRLSAGQVGVIVKRAAAAGGLDASKYGGHSLRAGYVTTARKQGIDWASIMEQTGHKRLETVKLYTRYTPDVFTATRAGDVFKNAFNKKKRHK